MFTGGGTDTQAPSTPANLNSPSRTNDSITLSWTASMDNVGVTGYDVLRAPGVSGGTFARIGTSATPTLTNSGLSPNTTFRYQVRARDAANNTSAVSNTVTVTTMSGGTGGGGCAATGTVQTQWQDGYVIQPATVTNSGTSTINGWTVAFDIPASHHPELLEHGAHRERPDRHREEHSAQRHHRCKRQPAVWLPGASPERQHSGAHDLYVHVAVR